MRRSRWKVILSVMDVNKLGIQLCSALTAIAALGSWAGFGSRVRHIAEEGLWDALTLLSVLNCWP